MTTNPAEETQSLTKQVATQIRIEMARQGGLRQSQLARRIGRTEQWLSVRLRGVQAIDLNDLAVIAAGLEVPVTELLPEEADVVVPLAGVDERSQPMRSRPTHARARREEGITPRYHSKTERSASSSSVRPMASNGPASRKPRDNRPSGRSTSAPLPPNLRRPARFGTSS
jgi:transcriptional regulator with XRE-family HTH domain